jgi:acetate kinase
MPDRARFYAISKETAEKGIVRYGYHGISFASLISKMTAVGKVPERIIICHLGSGSSIGAFLGGKSIDTSMGFTPLEGIPMATRVGDIDPGAVIYLMKKFGFGPNELEEYLNTHCGLLGLSGKSDDLRTLIDLEKAGDKKAALAIDVLVYKIKKYIGAYTAALNGLDTLVFSGTIGERSFFLRSRICRDMENLGIILDDERNNNTVSRDGFIQSASSKVKIAVMITDEMGEIAGEAAQIIS